jgi:hypothetical protein
MVTTPRRDPYELLIQQFLQNVQQGSQAVEQRFQGQRQERLIGEERDFQTGLIADERTHQAGVRGEQRAYETDVRGEQRRDALQDMDRNWIQNVQRFEMELADRDTVEARTVDREYRNEAAAIRNREATTLRGLLGFIDPASEEYAYAKRVLDAMMMPIGEGVTGEQARDLALGGRIVLDDDEEISFHNLIGALTFKADQIRRSQEGIDKVKDTISTHLMTGTIDPAERTAYYNAAIATSSLFNDAERDALLAAIGIDDPQARRAIVTRQRLDEANIASIKAGTNLTNAQVAATLFDLDERRSLSELTYQDAQLTVAQKAHTLGMSEAEMFHRTGIIPSDNDRATLLARALGFSSREEFEATGMANYARLQRQLKAETEISVNQAMLLGRNADATMVQTMMNRLLYNRAVVYGAIEDRTNLTELAFAASLAGDVETLRLLEVMSLEDQFAPHMQGMQFDTLIRIATEVRGDQDDVRRVGRIARGLDVASQMTEYLTNQQMFIMAIGNTFLTSDFDSLDEDIATYISQFTDDHLAAMQTTRPEFTRQVRDAAVRAKAFENRSAASMAMEAMAQNVPPGPMDDQGIPILGGALTPEQTRWRAVFLEQANNAGMDPDVAEQIADGLLLSGNTDYYMAMLDGEEAKSRIEVNLANAAMTRRQLELLENTEGVMLDKDTYSALRLGVETMMNSVTARLNSAYCTTDSGLGKQLVAKNADECTGLVHDLLFYEQEMQNLTRAFSTQSPYSYGAFTESMLTPDVRVTEALATVHGWGNEVREDYLSSLSVADPTTYAIILDGVSTGEIANSTDMNAALSQAMNEIADSGFQNYLESAPMNNPAFSLQNRAHFYEVQKMPEWQELIDTAQSLVQDGKYFSDAERRRYAEQFGWVHEGSTSGVNQAVAGAAEGIRNASAVPEWARETAATVVGALRVGTAGSPNLNAFDIAVQQSLHERGAPTIRPFSSVPPDSIPEPLMNAIMASESTGMHRGGPGSIAGPDELTRSKTGALGITQILPSTALSPGFGVKSLIPDEHRAEAHRLYSEFLGTRSLESLWAFNDYVAEILEDVPESEFIRFGQDYFRAMLTRYDGDVEKGLAAYKEGPGVVDGFVEEHGSNWREHFAAAFPGGETYVAKTLAAYQSSRGGA